MAEGMHQLAADPALRQRLAATAIEDVREFSVQHTIAMSEAGYHELLKEREA